MDTWDQIILHADMDAFYAAVEQRDDPSLRGKPVLIGPNSYRGVVLTASYEARRFGVGSGMPMAEARRRCPQALIVPPVFSRYQAVSEQVMDIFADFSPQVEALSLDEAFIDMSGASHFFGSPADMARAIKERVYAETQLRISVGASTTKYVAKVASAHEKPDGLTVVPPDRVVAWLAPQSVGRLWGVGRKTLPRFIDLGLETIGDVATADPAFLAEHLGHSGLHFYELANGRDDRKVARGRSARSIGSERTLSEDVSDPEDIMVHLRRSAERISRRLRTKEYVARGIRLRLKTTGFDLLTRQRALRDGVDSSAEMLKVARELLPELLAKGPFRLVGMAAYDLDWRNDGKQFDLFERQPNRKLEKTIDDLASRFGRDLVMRGSDLGHPGTVSSNGVNLDFLDVRDGERVATPARKDSSDDNQ